MTHGGTRFKGVAREWIVDSGADNHSKSPNQLTDEEKESATWLPHPIAASTGAGITQITQEIVLELEGLGVIDAQLLPECDLNLLSLGQLVLEQGYRFYWEGRQPHLVTPQGKHLWLSLKNNTPILSTYELVVNKIYELEAYQIMTAARLQSDSDATPNTSKSTDAADSSSADVQAPQSKACGGGGPVAPVAASAEERPDSFFYLEIFAGSARLSNAIRKKLTSVGRSDVRVISIDIRTDAKDDILRAECFLRIRRLVNSGKCLGVWLAPPCSS